MKKLIFTMFALFICSVSNAQTETMNWYVEGALYDTTTCESGGDIDLPTSPTKYGYTFQGWWLYDPIEYLESNGTQYIDTGVAGKNTLRVYMTLFVPGDTNNDIGWFFGEFSEVPNEKLFAGMFFPLYSSDSVRFDYANQKGLYCNASRPIINSIISIDYNNNHEAYVYDKDNNLLCSQSFSSSEFTALSNIYLFAANSKRTNTVDITPKTKIYSVKMWDNNVLVRDFVPVLDYNGVPCMFDKVTETFFYNKGSGDFIAGPIVEE